MDCVFDSSCSMLKNTHLEGNAFGGLAGMTEGHGALGRSISARILPVAGEDELEGRFRRHLQRMRRCGGHLDLKIIDCAETLRD